MKVLSIVGARPQFVKLAPVAEALSAAEVDHVIVHTGQHYDHAMSQAFFADLEIPNPAVNLGVGSGSHGAQTGAMLGALDEVFAEHVPDWVLVYGDTNSTLAGAVAAVKQHIPVAHLEAGLRSFNRRMPEEHNRVLTDHASDLLLAPTEVAVGHLAKEGLAGRTLLVGDVMTDVCLRVRDALATEPIAEPAEEYVVATIHRADNTDDPRRLTAVLNALRALDIQVRLLAHPRLVARCDEFGLTLGGGAIVPMQPLPYMEMVRALMGSRGVVTDSGGLQKEAYLLDVPCTTLRTETEWTETLVGGWNILDASLELVHQSAARARPADPRSTPYGDGHAADKTVQALIARCRG